jgi:hypothetical protein
LRICEECGAEYGYPNRGKRFCSRSCRTSWQNRVNNPAKSDAARAKIAAARRGKPTTSGRVLPQSQRDKIANALTGRALTDEHRAAIGNGVRMAGCIPPRNPHLIGPAHPNWKGGTRPARSADFSNPEYKAWRRAALDRDGWTCVDCGANDPARLHAHHVKPWAEHPALRYEIGNGVTVCRPCHTTRHRGVPRPVGVGPRTVADLRSGQTSI